MGLIGLDMKGYNQSCFNNNPKQQNGTALITVVLIAAVVIVLVLESVKTIRYQKQLSSNIINRDQATSYLMGMEELAKIWLKKSFENVKEETVHLNQSWAQDNITFPIDGGGMTASIKDMQSCFNLNSIAIETNNQQGQTPNASKPPVRGGGNSGINNPANPINSNPLGQDIFEELVNQVKGDSDITGKALAAATRDWIDEDTEPFEADGAEDDYYMGFEVPYRTANTLMAHSSELLTIKDVNQAIYAELLPYVCILPDANSFIININTVTEDSALLIYAALGAKGIGLSDVTKAIGQRGDKGYETVKEFLDELGPKSGDINQKYIARLGVSSEYFQMNAKAEIGSTRVSMKTLFKKDDKNNFKVVSRYYGKD